MTTIVLQTSVEKCSASASSASLGNFFTTFERARARRHVDHQGERQHDHSGDAGLDMHGAEEKPLKRFENNVESGDQEKRGLDERREIFEFAVTVGMALVGRLIGNADR